MFIILSSLIPIALKNDSPISAENMIDSLIEQETDFRNGNNFGLQKVHHACCCLKQSQVLVSEIRKRA